MKTASRSRRAPSADGPVKVGPSKGTVVVVAGLEGPEISRRSSMRPEGQRPHPVVHNAGALTPFRPTWASMRNNGGKNVVVLFPRTAGSVDSDSIAAIIRKAVASG